MAKVYPDRVAESGCTWSGGTLTLSGTAVTDFRTAAAAVAQMPDASTVDVVIVETGVAWEVLSDMVYSSGGATFTGGTSQSSSGTFSGGSVVAYIGTAGATIGSFLTSAPAPVGHIKGLAVSRASITQMQISRGEALVNGSLVTVSSTLTTLTSDSASLSADTLYIIYLVSNGGTPNLHLQEYTGTGAGAAPVENTTIDQWSHPDASALATSTNNDDYRLLGYAATDSASEFYDLRGRTNGRMAWQESLVGTAPPVLNAGAATSPATFAIDHVVPPFAEAASFTTRVLYGSSAWGAMTTAGEAPVTGPYVGDSRAVGGYPGNGQGIIITRWRDAGAAGDCTYVMQRGTLTVWVNGVRFKR